jgi:hypothetical protein
MMLIPFNFFCTAITHLVSHHQTLGQNQNLLTSNKSFENVAKFKYLETTETNKNCNHEEIRTD